MSSGQDRPSPMPHQQALVDRFFAEPNRRGYLVQSDVGLGSAAAMSHVAARLLKAQPTARILALCSRVVLQKQMEHILNETGLRAESVDRFRFREMQDAAAQDDAIWQEGRAFVLSTGFAKQDDIARSLCAVSWTLLIVPEAHQLSGLSRQVVQRLIECSPDIRLLFFTPLIEKDVPSFGIDSWTTIKWRHAEMVNEHGQPLFHRTPTKIESFQYQLSSQETQLRMELAALGHLLAATDGIPAQLARVIARTTGSSSAALEETLQRLRNRLIHRDGIVFSPDEELDEEMEARDVPPVIAVERTKLVELLDSCLAVLDTLVTDSKLALLWELVSEGKAFDEMPRAMCILTEYRATLFYIQEALEGIGVDAYALHGAMSADESARAISEFNNGGVLIITTTMITGVDLRQVDTLVLYDLPRSPTALDQVYGCFQRVGRDVPLVVQTLIESGNDDPAVNAVLGRLRVIGNDTETK